MTEAWVQSLFDDEPEVYGPKEKPKGHGPDRGTPKIHDPRDKRDVKERSFHDSPNGAPPLDWWNVSEEEVRRRLIRSMCPERVCRTCGEPSRRIVETERLINGQPTTEEYRRPSATIETSAVSGGGIDTPLGYGRTFGTSRTTLGWSDCGHDDWRPGLVLDCFGGSGTTALVATGHGRDCILIDLDERNFDLALERVGPFILTRGDT